MFPLTQECKTCNHNPCRIKRCPPLGSGKTKYANEWQQPEILEVCSNSFIVVFMLKRQAAGPPKTTCGLLYTASTKFKGRDTPLPPSGRYAATPS